MNGTRRKFLKAAGATAVVVASGKPLLSALAQDEHVERATGGKRWAMLVDASKCKADEGCRACRVACHKAHNVPDVPNRRHEVKWIWLEPFGATFPEESNEFLAEELRERPLPVLCNHCENPPCVRVCPTEATWKRADGIVAIDMHRCIGCRYCIAGCPYGSRSFNWVDPGPHIAERNPSYPTRMRGVVEKCNFCEERLARGERPACVEACPEGALVHGDLDAPDSALTERLRHEHSLRRMAGLGTRPKVYYII